jgi:hypothetical protein
LPNHNFGCPTFRGFRKVGATSSDSMFIRHSQALRFHDAYANAEPTPPLHGAGCLHFITTSQNRDLVLKVLE